MAGRFRGVSFDQALEHALETSSAEGLCAPLLLEPGALAERLACSLASWGVFNPFGSSRVRILAVETDGPALLVQDVGHPRHPRAVLRGLSSGDPLPALRRLFDWPGAGGEDELLPVPPTHVDLAGSELGEGELAALVCGSLAGRARLDLAACCELVERHGSDVAARTKDELRGALGTVMDRYAGCRRLPGPPSAELLARWWALVTDPAHVAGERAAMDALGSAHLRVRPPLNAC